ncbi:Major facilitator superfamily and Major facilitator superfamily domain, general substrate transporter-containing protein [Strongyloides ratti]|uniref:Major facilitator superfamily and Major facilitator superfamily domain, general substrate transporter-containing protein n=1 Tax=Strongyloides ratti TaxID=34506 RepID=A0A090L392_STRRB|nr:Major facilitator superfamily and Major facilitator superfamily domain, general substrate transporter-containing protein [Strongyloides ratti]CEF64177.1 Major facilitator superfamily and Major facilitator superfamily domain, general substrate transporter-containing protein [Strongyloides ratti]
MSGSRRPDHLKFDDDDDNISVYNRSQNLSNGLDTITTFGKTNWKNIIIIAFIAFTSIVPESTITPIEWAYLQISDSKVDEAFYGYLTSANALGQVISSTTSGFISNHIQQVKAPMIFGYFIIFISCGIYLSLEFISDNRRFVFLLFEFTIGIATGCIRMYRVHIAMAANDKDKPKAFAIVSIATVVALIIGPLIQYIIAFVFKYPGVSVIGNLHLNIFTVPGYLILFFSIIAILILTLFFSSKDTMKNSEAIIINKKINEIQMEDLDDISIGNGHSLYDTLRKKKEIAKKQIRLDYLAIMTCFIIKLAVTTTAILLRTTMIPYIQTVFAFNAKQLVKYTTFIQISIAILSLICYLSYIFFKINEKLKEKVVIIIGLSLYILFYLVTYPWNFYSYTIRDNLDKNMEIDSRINFNATDICRYSWCSTTLSINGWVIFPAIIIVIGIASPLILINLEVLYSKLLKTVKQGTMQGLFMSLGDLLSIFCPIFYNNLYEMSGPKTIWIIQLFINIFTLLIILLLYNRLSPIVSIITTKK